MTPLLHRAAAYVLPLAAQKIRVCVSDAASSTGADLTKRRGDHRHGGLGAISSRRGPVVLMRGSLIV
jgi:hypothetical protein